jgi:hypothetical protein
MWGSSTATDPMPIGLRCECGAITREAIRPIQGLQAEVERLRDELAFQAKNAADAHVERSQQQRRAYDALETLSEVERMIAAKLSDECCCDSVYELVRAALGSE